MPINALPVAQNATTTPGKTYSPKREFEQILRKICALVSQSRVLTGDFIGELVKQTEASAGAQKKLIHKGLGSMAFGVLAGVALSRLSTGNWKNALDAGQMGYKVGEGAQMYFSAEQKDHDADQQRIQQALASYNSFDQRAQGMVQTIQSFLQRQQQMEQEQALNR